MSQHASLEKAASPSPDLSPDPVHTPKLQTPSLDIQTSPNLSQAVDSSSPRALSIHVQTSPDPSTAPSALDTPVETTAKGSANGPKTPEPSSKRHTINFSRPIPIMTAYNATMTDSANGSPPSTKRGSPDTQHRDYPANRHIPYYYSPASDGQQTSKRTRTEESMTGSPSTDSTLTPPADSPLENEDQSGSVTPELPSSMGASGMAGYPHPFPTETGSHQQDFFNPFVTPFWNPYGSNGNGSMCLASSLQATRSVPAYEKMPYDGPSTWQKPPMMTNHQDFLLAPPTTTGIPRCSSFPTSGPSSTKNKPLTRVTTSMRKKCNYPKDVPRSSSRSQRPTEPGKSPPTASRTTVSATMASGRPSGTASRVTTSTRTRTRRPRPRTQTLVASLETSTWWRARTERGRPLIRVTLHLLWKSRCTWFTWKMFAWPKRRSRRRVRILCVTMVRKRRPRLLEMQIVSRMRCT